MRPAILLSVLGLLAGVGAGAAAQPAPLSGAVVQPYLSAQRLVDIGSGRRLNLVCMGQGGTPVVFEAGGSDWSSIWAVVQPQVARDTLACAYDRAGLGYSDPAPGRRSPLAIVEDLHALLQAAGLRRPVILVGHSLGGFTVKLHAALYPEDVAGLVLVDAAEERTWPRTRRAVTGRWGPQVAARAELLDQQFLARLTDHYRECAAMAKAAGGLQPGSTTYRHCTDPPRPQLGPEIAAAREAVQKTDAYQAAQASEIGASVYADPEAEPVYARLFRPGAFGNLPLVVLTHAPASSDDPVEALGEAQGVALHAETARLSRRGEHRVIAGSGHHIELDAPEAVVQAVRAVLRTSAERGPWSR